MRPYLGPGILAPMNRFMPVKFSVWGFFIMFYRNMVMKMLKCKNENLMTSHFGTVYDHKWHVGKCFTSECREKYISYVVTEHTLYHKHLTDVKLFLFWKLSPKIPLVPCLNVMMQGVQIIRGGTFNNHAFSSTSTCL